ncbi:MAG: hypothetical protein AAFO84_04620 [Cyanobacteria bacterium J06598_1]
MRSVYPCAKLLVGLSVVLPGLLLSPGALAAGPTGEAVSAPAAESPAEVPATTPLIIDESVDPVETANYSDGTLSIDYPATWEISVDEAGDLAIDNASDVLLDRVETQLFRVASPPGPLVNANIDSFIEEGAAVSRYSSVEIDEQSALVMWLADRPDEELSSAIATFIGYGDNTIMLFSRYAPENATAEDSILRLHSSFTKLSDTDLPESEMPELETPETTDSETTPIEVDSSGLEDAPALEDSSILERSPAEIQSPEL